MSNAEVKMMMDDLAIDNNPAEERPEGQLTQYLEEPYQDMDPVQGDHSIRQAKLAADDASVDIDERFQEFMRQLSKKETYQVEGADLVGEAEHTSRPVQADGNSADALRNAKIDWAAWENEIEQHSDPRNVPLEHPLQNTGNDADDSDLPPSGRDALMNNNAPNTLPPSKSGWDEWVVEGRLNARPLHRIPQPLAIQNPEVTRRALHDLLSFQGLECQADASRPDEEVGVGGIAGLNEEDENTQDPVTPPPNTYHPLRAVSPMQKGTNDGRKRPRSPPSPRKKMPMTKEPVAVWMPMVVSEMPLKRRRKANQTKIKPGPGFQFVPQEDPTDHRS